MLSRLPQLLKALAFASASLLALVATAADSERIEHHVDSPDGHIRVSVETEGVLGYRVTIDGTAIVNESRMGLRLRGGSVLGDNVTMTSQTSATVDTNWTNPLGKRSQVRDNHNELRVSLREKGDQGREFSVVFRVFNDGVGFRYEMPRGSGAADFVVDEELTEFAFSTDSECYAGDHIASPPDA